MKRSDYEEEFHNRDRKKYRKERKVAQRMDRSKFKKTDLEKTNERQKVEGLSRGRIVSIAGEGILVHWEGAPYLCTLKGVLKKEKGLLKNLVAVGDWVRFSPEEKAIYSIEERTSSLARVDISGKKEQLLAANIDQTIITASLLEPPLKPALVDRYLIAAEKGGLHPIICINKIDLLETAPEGEKELFSRFLSAYELLGYPILSVSAKTGIGIEALRSLLQGKTSVFSGQSGVGKSSLLNACFGLQLKVGDLAVKTQKGTHTTTTAELLALPGGGYCVDTPGVRSFGIWDLKKEEVVSHFRDFALFAARCKFPDCTHAEEPSCAVLDALEKGKISSLRYESYQTLLGEALGRTDGRTWN